MANNSSSQSSGNREYVVRVPKTTRKRYHMMRFNSDLGTEFFKTWTQCRMERENNLREYKLEEETPKFGAGSEFGREQREEARRKRFGINVKKYKSENQPWMLNIGGKTGKKYKGIREGGVADNTSWYVFMQGKDGSFEAYPVDEWYNFQPVQRYKALSAEEAEEEFIKRDKIMNFFQVMYTKKFKKDAEPDEEEGKKKGGGGGKKSLMLSEMDEWFSEDDDEADDDDEDRNEDDDSDKKKKKKKPVGKKKSQGGKKKKVEGGESEDSCEEESDDMNEGVEHDYISSDSSDSDQENEEIAGKEMASVAEGDALRKLLESDDDEEEENKDKEKEEEEEEKKEEEKVEEKGGKKKKKKKKDKKSDKDSEGSSDYSSDENKKKKHEGTKSSEKKNAVNELKRKVKENPMEMPPQKKSKMDNSGRSVSNSGNSSASTSCDSMEEAIKRYLTRKPMTTTELLKLFKKKKDMSSEQLVTTIAQILKRVNPVKRMIKGKMYLSLKTT